MEHAKFKDIVNVLKVTSEKYAQRTSPLKKKWAAIVLLISVDQMEHALPREDVLAMQITSESNVNWTRQHWPQRKP